MSETALSCRGRSADERVDRTFFSLTEGGEERFPKRYDRLADLALQEVALLEAEEIAGLSPEDKKRLLLPKMADRVYESTSRGCKTKD